MVATAPPAETRRLPQTSQRALVRPHQAERRARTDDLLQITKALLTRER